MSLDLQTPPTGATRRDMAAIIVRLMRAQGTDLPLAKLPEDTQVALTRTMGSMGPVNHDTLNNVVDEFTRALESLALTATGGMPGALAALDGAISPAAAARMADEMAQGNPEHAWDRLAKLDIKKLAHIASQESVEIASLLMSKLPVEKAAEVLGHVAGAHARQIACTTAQIDDVSTETLGRIAHALVAEYCNQPKPSFESDAVSRVGAILNSTPRDRRDEVLEGLETDDPDFAGKVRKAIFTFANIPDRIPALDIPKAIRPLEGEQLVAALAGALKDSEEDKRAAEYMLNNMSKRMAGQLREEIDEAGDLKRKTIDEAQNALISAIRKAIDAGEIIPIVPDEDEE